MVGLAKVGAFAVAGAVFWSGCAADGGARRVGDGGGGGTDVVGGQDSGVIGSDSGGGGTDVPGVDTGPRIDSGCDMATPIGTEIIGDPPDMLLSVDISGSMCTPLFGLGMDTKLKIMKAALTELVMTKDARINFGMMLYPASSGACDPGTVNNAIAPMNAGPISSTLAGLQDSLFSCAFSNSGATPTHISMDAARTYYGTVPVNPIGRYVLLATDGVPNCGPELPDGGTEETVDETVAAIEALSRDGISTYVLGFGSDLTGDPATLMRMATAGGTGRAFSATSPAELSTALDAIAAEIIPPSCTVALDGAARDPALFQVSFDGTALIPRNTGRTSGWDYDAATNTITFYGSECDRLQSGEVASVEVDFGCPGPLI